jgi:hypothetical protein
MNPTTFLFNRIFKFAENILPVDSESLETLFTDKLQKFKSVELLVEMCRCYNRAVKENEMVGLKLANAKELIKESKMLIVRYFTLAVLGMMENHGPEDFYAFFSYNYINNVELEREIRLDFFNEVIDCILNMEIEQSDTELLEGVFIDFLKKMKSDMVEYTFPESPKHALKIFQFITCNKELCKRVCFFF